MKHYIKLAFYFNYKKITVVGYENIPKKGALLFVCNHPNALIDPLMVKTHTYKHMSVLTRAGVFKNKFIIKIFESVKMIPIYRKRDGWNAISKNDAVFNRCYNLLNEKKSILIFPEGSHSILRKVRPLTKGFARIIFGTFDKFPDAEIQIVPVGLNYSAPTKYPDSVSIHFGEPFNAKDFYNPEDILLSIDSLKGETQKRMQKLATHIDGDTKTYESTLEKLKTLNVDFSDPIKTNEQIKNINSTKALSKIDNSKSKRNLLYYLVILNSIIPYLVWKKVNPTVRQLEFKTTTRIAISASLFPLIYIIQSFIVGAFFDKQTALIYFSASLFSSYILSKTLKVND